MPIYAYRCSTCGHAKDVLQKMSDPVLTVCPDCGASTFVKQVTAAGFQLKGSGWYVTDFRGGDKAAAAKPADGASADAAKADTAAPAPAGAAKSDAAPAPSAAPAPAPAPALAAPKPQSK
ncbi:MAG: FmdB family zinc ribbon protein [Pseudomonadota bacterium]